MPPPQQRRTQALRLPRSNWVEAKSRAGDEDQLHKKFCCQFSALLNAPGKEIMDIFKRIWTEESTGDQQTEQTRESKASPDLKRQKENDYRAQDITINAKAEVIEVEPLRSQSR